MLNTKLSTEARNAQLRAFSALLNGGSIRIYDGVQPTNTETAVDKQKLLATLAFGAVAFGNPSNATIAANKISDCESAPASGTATWARLIKSDGTAVMDGSVGQSDANVIMAAVNISAGVRVSIKSLSINLPMQGDK
jgi:hypothetical protein